MSVKDLIAGLNNRVYVKHIRGDEKKASHSRTQLGACVTGGYGKEKRQKRSSHDWLSFFVRGCLWKCVETSSSV